jgi:hypothetical protein
MQKGALAALAVDNTKQTKGPANNSLNPEELRDCFTLKESCNCDTKNKVENWPDYSECVVLLHCHIMV